MKKVLFLLFVGLFFNSNVFSKSLVNNTSEESLLKTEKSLFNPPQDCVEYANTATQMEIDCYGPHIMTPEEISNTYQYYLGLCNEAKAIGVWILLPILLDCIHH